VASANFGRPTTQLARFIVMGEFYDLNRTVTPFPMKHREAPGNPGMSCKRVRISTHNPSSSIRKERIGLEK